MTIPEISARVDAAIDCFPLIDLDGTRALALVLKQRLRWGDDQRLARAADAVIHPVDVPWPDAGSPMYPSDLCLRKPQVDVVVIGTATADRSVGELLVHAAVGPLAKSLKVFGPRVWYRGLTGIVPTPPERFERLPLIWEHAFGGMDVSDPKRVVEEARNPLGRGVAADPASLEHQPVPQIEDPRELIASARTRPKPAGIGPIGPNFMPRRGYAGTFDQRWQDERMPLFPLDFDPRFHQVADPEMVGPLRGDEPVQLLNIGRPGPTKFALPRLVFQADARTDRGVVGYRPALDTIEILADERAVDLVFRVAIPMRPPPERVREVLVYEKRVI